jgi:hypothetical protein
MWAPAHRELMPAAEHRPVAGSIIAPSAHISRLVNVNDGCGASSRSGMRSASYRRFATWSEVIDTSSLRIEQICAGDNSQRRLL